MYTLSDLFAYLYFIDLHSLDLAVVEAIRILVERRRKAARTISGPNVPINSSSGAEE